MKALVCELCGGNDFVKEGDFFVCQSCGTKYSSEDAKKMMIEGTVEVHGTVRIDSTNEINNLHQAAKNAMAIGDYESAIKHYETISSKEPNNWRALFYQVILKTHNIKNAEIGSATAKITNSLQKVLELIRDNSSDEEEKKTSLKEVVDECCASAVRMMNYSMNYYKTQQRNTHVVSTVGGVLNDMSRSIQNSSDNSKRCLAAANIVFLLGNIIESLFPMTDDVYKSLAVQSWKKGMDLDKAFTAEYKQVLISNESSNRFSSKINKYDPSYPVIPIPPEKKRGCYVATCVYGSYDCPEVWTLRRYRDYTLAGTWYGRAFIHTYYAISPTLVKWFGKTKWFKNIFKPKLDKMVAKLNASGVEDTPYNDRNW